MSPAIAKTNDDQIIAATKRLVRKHGADRVTLKDVAQAVGIRAPSLYKRFTDRNALLSQVKDDVIAELLAVLTDATSGTKSPRRRLLAMARAYRAFAKAYPELYRLVFAPELKDEELLAERRLAEPVLVCMVDLVGEDNALAGARSITSLLHGFCTLEIEGNFRFGGSVNDAFEFSVSALLDGIASK